MTKNRLKLRRIARFDYFTRNTFRPQETVHLTSCLKRDCYVPYGIHIRDMPFILCCLPITNFILGNIHESLWMQFMRIIGAKSIVCLFYHDWEWPTRSWIPSHPKTTTKYKWSMPSSSWPTLSKAAVTAFGNGGIHRPLLNWSAHPCSCPALAKQLNIFWCDFAMTKKLASASGEC